MDIYNIRENTIPIVCLEKDTYVSFSNEYIPMKNILYPRRMFKREEKIFYYNKIWEEYTSAVYSHPYSSIEAFLNSYGICQHFVFNYQKKQNFLYVAKGYIADEKGNTLLCFCGKSLTDDLKLFVSTELLYSAKYQLLRKKVVDNFVQNMINENVSVEILSSLKIEKKLYVLTETKNSFFTVGDLQNHLDNEIPALLTKDLSKLPVHQEWETANDEGSLLIIDDTDVTYTCKEKKNITVESILLKEEYREIEASYISTDPTTGITKRYNIGVDLATNSTSSASYIDIPF